MSHVFSGNSFLNTVLGVVSLGIIPTVLNALGGSKSSPAATPATPAAAVTPTPLPTPTAAAAPPTTATPSVQSAADQTAQDNAAAAGRSSTLLTSGLGASDQLTTAKKTLLGA